MDVYPMEEVVVDKNIKLLSSEEVDDDLDIVSEEEISNLEKSDFDYKELVQVTDDFSVPKDFNEFYLRYPKYVRTWLIRHRCPYDLIEDFEQEMYQYILTVSDNGRAKGIYDRIVSFNGERIGGKSAGKFFFYINLLLTRKYMVLIRRRTREPITQRTTITIEDSSPSEAESYVPNSSSVESLVRKYGGDDLMDSGLEDRLFTDHFIRGFRQFLKKNEESALKSLDLFLNYNSVPDISKNEGISIEDINKIKNRLRILANVYQKGLEKIPTKRKTYNKRKKVKNVND